MTARVFGLGHPDRGDDAVGLLVADAVARQSPAGIVVRRIEGSPLELLAGWAAEDDVIVVDAVRSVAPPGEVMRIDAITGPLSAAGAGGGTHDASLVYAVEMARALGRLPSHLTVYGITGTRFAVGDPPTPVVLAAVAPTAAAIVATLS